MKKIFLIVACLSQFMCAVDIDKYFNGGNPLNGASSYPLTTNCQFLAAVDLYDNIITFYYDSTTKKLTLTKIDERGALVSGFGTNGVKDLVLPVPETLDHFKMEIDPISGDFLIGFSVELDESSEIFIMRFLSSTGAFDTSFGVGGFVSIEANFVDGSHSIPMYGFSGLHFDSQGRILVTTVNLFLNQSTSKYKYYFCAWRYSNDGILQLEGSNNFQTIERSRFNDMPNNKSSVSKMDSQDNIYFACIIQFDAHHIPLYCIKFTLTDVLLFDNSFGTGGIYTNDNDGTSVVYRDRMDNVQISLSIVEANNVTKIFTYTYMRESEGESRPLYYTLSIFNSNGTLSYETTQFFWLELDNPVTYIYNISVSNQKDTLIFCLCADNKLYLFKSIKYLADGGLYTDHVKTFVERDGDHHTQGIASAFDSGEALVAFSVEKSVENNFFATRRFLAGDDVSSLKETSSLNHTDLIELANYSNDLTFLNSYFSIYFTPQSKIGVVFGTLFAKAISRATVNNFPSCLAMKFKKGQLKNILMKC